MSLSIKMDESVRTTLRRVAQDCALVVNETLDAMGKNLLDNVLEYPGVQANAHVAHYRITEAFRRARARAEMGRSIYLQP